MAHISTYINNFNEAKQNAIHKVRLQIIEEAQVKIDDLSGSSLLGKKPAFHEQSTNDDHEDFDMQVKEAELK